MDNHFPWGWVLSAFSFGGCLGFLIAAMLVSSTMKYLKHWNRRLQKERDDALENEEMREEITNEEKDDARKYRELMKEKQ